jgi:hypothetical protein
VHEADEGHTFEFTVRIRSSSKVTGDEHYHDAPEFGEPLAVQMVRAWSLREALTKLIRQPLYHWFPDEDHECPTCKDLGFTTSIGAISGAIIHSPCPDCPAGEREAQRLP